jgi:ribosomal-protein-alanine N-acetyltransferase
VAPRYLTWQPHRTIANTQEFVRESIAAWDNETLFIWAILLKDGTFVGCISLRFEDFKVEAGYAIARAHWGKGITPEALRELIDWALDLSWVYRVWAVCDIENPASARVMEKVGMTREGILRKWSIHPQTGDTPRDCYCYSIVKNA